MESRMARRALWPAWGIALLYVALGVVWIAVSDELVLVVAETERQAHLISTVKGIGYVVVTGALLYALIQRSLKSIVASNAAVREVEGRLRVFMRRPDVMVFVKSEDGTYLVASEALALLYGMGQEEVVGSTDERLFGAETADAMRERDLDAIRRGASSEREETLPLPGGPRTVSVVRLPLSLHGPRHDALVGLVSPVLSDAVAHRAEQRAALERMMREESEEFVEALAAVRDELSALRTETETLRQESETLQSEHARLTRESRLQRAKLAQSSGRLDAVVAQMDAVVRAFDVDGVITLSEGGALGFLGARPGQDSGRSIYDLYDDDMREVVARVLRGTTARAAVRIQGQELEARFAPVMDGERVIGGVVVETPVRIEATS